MVYIKYKHISKRKLNVYNIFKIFFINSPTIHVLTCVTRNRHVLNLTPTRARALALYIMGGRQWLIGDAYALTCKQVLSTLRYGVWANRGWWCDTEPTGRKLLIFKIWTLQTNIMFIYSAPLFSSPSSYIYFTSCTTCSTYLYCRIIVQVIRPPGARTSPPINWSDR